ncbi:helix-hairpin-helix domain-containing protein [Arthrobacter sp. NPDC058097]|uniref:helix-hairpin-helix domain-containing protein n=1 Tax=Arthrobacter sp. NPDC058097 TaxID=3346340 RepID=UPI0036DACA33
MQGRTTDGRTAKRLAASLGPPTTPGLAGNTGPTADEEPDRQPGGGSTGLLEAGTGGGFSYGRPTGSTRSAESAEAAEPRFRWRLGIRAAALVGVLSLIAGVLLWWQVAANGPVVLPLSSVTYDAAATPATSAADKEGNNPDGGGTEGSDGNDTDAKGADGAGAGGANSPGANGDGVAGNVVVHVAGAVKKTGVVRLPRGSRVHEAIAAAGGARPEADLDRLNLASPLEDGQKIYVPRRGEAAPADTTGAAPADKSGAAGTSGVGGAPVDGNGGPAGNASGGKINLNTATVEELGELPRVGPVLAQRIVDWRTQQGPFKSPEELDAVDGVGPKMLETLLPLVTV